MALDKMNTVTVFRDLGIIDYASAWKLQEEVLAEMISAKQSRSGIPEDQQADRHHLLFCEHPHVYTIGKSGSEANLLVNPEILREKQIGLFRSNRGGDITYHGPGQIVGYPIFDLEKLRMPVRQYVFSIEESIIRTLTEFGITAGRLPGAAGVWIDPENSRARKICAIGVRVSRSVTMHGFALNVNTDLSFFSHINPCGFTDKTVTSMEKEAGKKIAIDLVKAKLKTKLCEVFQMELQEQ